jgi:hypothetical protein
MPTFEDLSVFNQGGVAKGSDIAWKGNLYAAPAVGMLRRQSHGPARGKQKGLVLRGSDKNQPISHAHIFKEVD